MATSNTEENQDSIEALRREIEALRARSETLRHELVAEQRKSAELDRARAGVAAVEVAELPSAISEFEETLRRLVQRTAMFVQAEKCVIMVLDRDTGDLIARSPAWGMSEDDVHGFRVHPDQGVSGAVFRS